MPARPPVDPDDRAIVSLGFEELRRRLDGRELTVRGLTEAHLRRIGELAGLRAYTHVDAPGALGSADLLDQELDAGLSRGPMHGIPIGVKGSIGVEGLPFTGGCTAFDDLVAPADATVVARLRAGGAVVLGIHALSENQIGVLYRDGPNATGANPRHADYVPGGSSSGSASATAAGLCVSALAADGGGSVRGPAAATGVIGLKPTDCSLPSHGCHPWTFTMGTVGVLGREIGAVTAMYGAITQTRTMLHRDEPPRLGLVEAGDLGELDPDVDAALSGFEHVVAAGGAEVDEAAPLGLEVGAAWLARMREFVHAHTLPLAVSPDGYSDFMKGLLSQLSGMSVEAYLDSFEVAASLRARVDDALEGLDALVLPASPRPALRWEEWLDQEAVFDWYRLCWPFNLSWHPAVVLPWSLSASGLPVAVQLVGRLGDEERLLGTAAWCIERGSYDPGP